MVAVDPADMDAGLLHEFSCGDMTKPQLVHLKYASLSYEGVFTIHLTATPVSYPFLSNPVFRKTLQAAQPELVEMGPFQVVLCDMNTEPTNCFPILSPALSHLVEGGHLILTMKLKRKTKRKVTSFLSWQLQELSKMLNIIGTWDVKVEHLQANKNERTLVAKLVKRIPSCCTLSSTPSQR